MFLLKLNFALSVWLSGSKKHIILKGASFLSLQQVAFAFTSIILIIKKYLELSMNPKALAIFVTIVSVLIMLGLEKKMIHYLQTQKLNLEYQNLKQKEVIIRRFLGISINLILFLLMFASILI